MSEEKKQVEDVTTVTEEVKQEEVREAAGVTEAQQPANDGMEAPKTTDYNMKYRISDAFLNDLQICLGEMEYVKAEPFIKFATAKKDSIVVAELSEFIKKLEYLPYKYVYRLIANFNDEKCLNQYFILINEGKKQG